MYRFNSGLLRKVLIILGIIIVLAAICFGGFLLIDKLTDKPLTKYAEEKVYKDDKGNIIERYSYIEISERKVDVKKLETWCTEYAQINADKYDKFIIKYKGKDKGIILSAENYITVNCKITEHKNGMIEIDVFDSDDLYNVSFEDGQINRYLHSDGSVINQYWNYEKEDWVNYE